ncbi:MAG TPA: SCO family protein [Rudaea sp.]
MNDSNTPRARPTLPFAPILIAAFAAALGLWFGARWFAAPAPPQLTAAVLYPQPRPVPEFHLAQANGQPLTPADWRGHWTLAYFGYASCPDVCPTTLAAFKNVWAQLEKRGSLAAYRFDFISVDPARDTPETLAKYVAFFRPDFIAATGTDAELTPLTRALGLLYTRSSTGNGDEQVDHSASVVIIDPQGRMAGIFRPPFAPDAIAADLAALAASGN